MAVKSTDEDEGVTHTTLANGTILTSFDNPPLPPLLADDLEPFDAPQTLTWRRDKPVMPKGVREDRWERLR